MKKIIAIGGGSLADAEGSAIDHEIISLSGKRKPAVLFIPTASSDDPEYIANFQKIYGEKLGCAVDVLLLLENQLTTNQIRKKISTADVIYVGGGNTLKMMRRWRFLGVDRLLIQACKNGKVMAGTSAGAICWFQQGHSDSMAYYHPDHWQWIRVKCLNILPFTACPHVLAEGRLAHFQKMISKTGDQGIALDNCAAIEVVGDQYRIIRANTDAKAFRVFKRGREVITEEFLIDKKFRSLSGIF